MIAFVKGNLSAVLDDSVVIDTGNIGYQVLVSVGTLAHLPPIGQEVFLHTYTHIREDVFALYGFASRDELDVFKQLIAVNGIGPKGGLSILSTLGADELRFAILTGDAKAIARAPGIGARTAERIIVDLKDSSALRASMPAGDYASYEGSGNAAGGSAIGDAVEALVALGYGATEAAKAVKKAAASGDMDAEELLKAGLKYLT